LSPAGAAIGRPHRHFRLTDSTNERAKELARAGAPGGLVVTADEQTAGRGRRGHSWFGPPGSSLLYSALLRPFSGDPLLSLAVPLAVCEAAERLAPVSCRVKWPNDVWIEDRKLAGALVETHLSRDAPVGEAEEVGRSDGGWAVIGIGLNVTVEEDDFPGELREAATSLAIVAANAELTLAAAIAMINERLARWVAASNEEVVTEFSRRDALAGRPISWDGGEGVAAGIDDRGHLLVDTGDDEPTALGAGEVHLSLER
jgi:BirA family biotin operon repressor/biotin-[acetyl-CoA-carboxylase] ligase